MDVLIVLGIVAAVLLSVAWLGNRNWGTLLGSAGAGCAGLCVAVLGVIVVPGAILAYAYGIDPHFMISPARELFWMAVVICGLSVVWSMSLISMDTGGTR